MKKTILLAVACAAALTTAAAPAQAAPTQAGPAQAAPKDPVAALKAKLAPGRGVHFTDTVTWSDGTNSQGTRDSKGSFQFGEKGVVGFDFSWKYGDEQRRTIAIGKTAYHSGGVYARLMPEGKTWFKRAGGGMPDSWAQFINPAEPKTLAKLIGNGSTKGRSVTGTITVKELRKVSDWVARAGIRKEDHGVKVDYTLTLAASGLVSRVQSTYAIKVEGEPNIVTVDSRYTGWGGKVSIKAPAPGTVTTSFR
ncbi:hypothetical protein [Nonomuraea candida]|uniref:hypothetical protein n=1 Tax=Nonomuraea candida TaxID=359159 RepID=UPI0005B89FC7|nr:hypothetical protein [Nonomuraea candida]